MPCFFIKVALSTKLNINLKLPPFIRETHCGHTSVASTWNQGKMKLNRKKASYFFVQDVGQRHPPDEEKNISHLCL